MRFSFAAALVLGLAVDSAVAFWGPKAPYNKWHETELERWLSDHNVKYPTPADRKDLENLVKTNWAAAVESPYASWDANRLHKHLQARGEEVKKGTEKNKNTLVKQVQGLYADAAAQANKAYADTRNFMFDSWTDSHLKAFADRHGIPVPQPRKRDTLLKNIREGYQNAATKLGETANYPGNWLYESWTESDLKAWLDQRGIPAPQPSNREKLIAQVRRNAYIAAQEVRANVASFANSADAARASLADEAFETYSDSKLKEFCDKNGIKVPQGSNRNEILALVRKHLASLTGDNVAGKAASAYGAATSSAGNEAAKASKEANVRGNQIYNNLYDQIMGAVDEALIMVGLKTNYASSASLSAAKMTDRLASAYASATKGVKGEL